MLSLRCWGNIDVYTSTRSYLRSGGCSNLSLVSHKFFLGAFCSCTYGRQGKGFLLWLALLKTGLYYCLHAKDKLYIKVSLGSAKCGVEHGMLMEWLGFPCLGRSRTDHVTRTEYQHKCTNGRWCVDPPTQIRVHSVLASAPSLYKNSGWQTGCQYDLTTWA